MKVDRQKALEQKANKYLVNEGDVIYIIEDLTVFDDIEYANRYRLKRNLNMMIFSKPIKRKGRKSKKI